MDCLHGFYFSFRVWMCHCSRIRTRVPNMTSCSPTLPTAETYSNWRKDRKLLSATGEWVTVFVSRWSTYSKYSLRLWITVHIYHQIIGPLEEEEVFNQDDFLLLESIILKTSGERIKSKVQHFGTEEDRYFISQSCRFVDFHKVKLDRVEFSESGFFYCQVGLPPLHKK